MFVKCEGNKENPLNFPSAFHYFGKLIRRSVTEEMTVAIDWTKKIARTLGTTFDSLVVIHMRENWK